VSARRAAAPLTAALVLLGCSRGPGTEDHAAADSLRPAPHPTRSLLAGGPYAYVTAEAGNAVTVIDLRADSVVASVQPGRRPRGVRVSPDGSTLIVAVSGSPRR